MNKKIELVFYCAIVLISCLFLYWVITTTIDEDAEWAAKMQTCQKAGGVMAAKWGKPRIEKYTCIKSYEPLYVTP